VIPKPSEKEKTKTSVGLDQSIPKDNKVCFEVL
jgi:hypothetical protein